MAASTITVYPVSLTTPRLSPTMATTIPMAPRAESPAPRANASRPRMPLKESSGEDPDDLGQNRKTDQGRRPDDHLACVQQAHVNTETGKGEEDGGEECSGERLEDPSHLRQLMSQTRHQDSNDVRTENRLEIPAPELWHRR